MLYRIIELGIEKRINFRRSFTRKSDTKKNGKIRESTPREKAIFINIYREKYSLTTLCRALDISKRTYYRFRNKPDSDDKAVELIYKIRTE